MYTNEIRLKHKPTQFLICILLSIFPLITYAQDYPVFPEKNHTTSISLTGFSIDLNSIDAGYTYKLFQKNNLSLRTGFIVGIFYPRIKLADLTKKDLASFVAPNIELAYGSKHVFYISFWKNFMKNNEAPFKSALGYRHEFVNKQLSIKAFGSFLWIKDDTQLESTAIFTYGGIGIGLERNF